MRPHGTYAAYAKDKCRCVECRGYQSARNAQNRADRLASGRLSHGRRSAYDAGCRCELCLGARQAAYGRENTAARARRAGGGR